MSDKIQMLDTVMTEHGQGLVVGEPEFDQLEVRLPNGNLHIVQRSAVTKGDEPVPYIDPVTPAPPDYNAAVLEVMQEQIEKPPAARSTLAQSLSDDTPRAASGRKLTGSALQRHLAKQAREQGS